MQEEIESVNLWCYQPENKHDKLYGLYLWKSGEEHFDVVSLFGVRGGKLQLHVWAEGVNKLVAVRVFRLKLKEKLGSRKGYSPISESVSAVGSSIPTLAEK